MIPVTIDIVAFIAGGIFILVGIVGGGIEVKEVKIPPILPSLRIAAIAFGLGFLTLGVWLNQAGKLMPTPQPAAHAPTAPPPENAGCQLKLRSPDGRYQASEVGTGNDIHYKVTDMSTGHELFTTQAQYKTPNDVKAGTFSPDSQEFAAAYHYGHEGSYTWIGVWNVGTGRFVRSERLPGWTTDICSVFNK
jgi:hypothetical protein